MDLLKNHIEHNQDWSSYVLTPVSKQAYPLSVHTTNGIVKDADHILTADDRTVHLSYPHGGEKPYLIVDLGPASPGGHAIFKVTQKSGMPVVRLAYSDWYDYLEDPIYGQNGDYSRGAATYLGVELPIPPANPYRYELYTINTLGEIIAPMVQGQQRWVRIQLDTEGTSVDIQYFYMENISDMSPYNGHFLCNDEDLNRIWYASTYTTQIASFANSDAWNSLNGWLIPRKLAKCNDIGLSKEGQDWDDYTFEFDFIIRKNPGPVSGVGWVFRALDENNGYVGQIDLDSKYYIKKRVNGVYYSLKQAIHLPITIIDGDLHHLSVVVKGKQFDSYLDGQWIDTTTDKTYNGGKVGFCQPLDKWALIDNVTVKDIGGSVLLADGFENGLKKWSYAMTPPFIADGAKRDRLPWLGDLDWAGRNVYYAFKNNSYMKETIKLFAAHQTPEGYIWAACYPENTQAPGIGNYGYYQSDEFSAWFVPTLADYLLFTGDLETTRELYPSVIRDIDYLWQYVEDDGLFFQRYETSKGIWGHILEYTGKGTYVNILIYDALMEAEFIATHLGEQTDAEAYRNKAEIMKSGINRLLWDSNNNFFVDKLGSSAYSFYPNALALAIGFLDPKRAAIVAKHLQGESQAKYQSLAIRGKFHYRFDDLAIDRIRQPGKGVSWIEALKDWRGPQTTWECMPYPPIAQQPGKAWMDMSHPDTAIAHLLTGYILGVEPTDIGFRRFNAIPHPCDLRWATGTVPTRYGDIVFSWSKDEGADFAATLVSPPGTTATLGIPKLTGIKANISVNGMLTVESNGNFHYSDSIRHYYEDEQYLFLEIADAGTYRVEISKVN